MKTVMTLWVGVLLCAFTSTVTAQSGEEMVKVKALVGKVEVHSPGTSQWRPARAGMPIKSKWDVRTYVESEVELEFASGTVVKLGENSVVNLAALHMDPTSKARNTGLKVASGQVFANVKKLVGTGSSFSFETPTAVASIRGTSLGIGVGSGGATTIDLYEGSVVVRNKGSKKELIISPSQRAVVTPGMGDITLLKFSEIRGGRQPFTLPLDTTAAGGPGPVNPLPGDSAGAGADTARADSASLGTDTVSAPAADTTRNDSATADTPDSIPAPPVDTAAPITPAVIDTARAPDPDTVAGVPPATTLGARSDSVPAIIAEPADTVVPVQKTVTLGLTILDPAPGATVDTSLVTVRGRTLPSSQGAVSVLVDGKSASVASDGTFSASLVIPEPGSYSFEVSAELDGKTKSESRTVVYTKRPPSAVPLTIQQPSAGAKVDTTIVRIAGVTTPGASVTVEGISVVVRGDGGFSYQLNIPDEPGSYSVTVEAEKNGVTASQQRSFVYEPAAVPLFLKVASPAEGQLIRTNPLHITGTTSSRAKVQVNGRDAVMSGVGTFNADIMLVEKNIGDLSFEVVAIDRKTQEEMSKTVAVQIDPTSSQINVSAPQVSLTGYSGRAVTGRTIVLQGSDFTPDDRIEAVLTNNGSSENITLDPGARENVNLEPGRNKLTVKAKDRAGNQAAAVSADIYCLPGPLVININEPDANPYVLDIPPMPSGVSSAKLVPIEVEIDDNIGTVSESIKYCTANGVQLKQNRYLFSGTVTVATRGTTNIDIIAEDIAGNKSTKRLVVRIEQ